MPERTRGDGFLPFAMSNAAMGVAAAGDMSEAFARAQDQRDELAPLRREFHFPQSKSGETLYFVGNSLGLQPKSVRAALEQELDDWARLGVEGHFAAKHPWLPYHEEVREPLARLVGALPHEVVAMNSLTTNLHLLMVSFYRPTKTRYKIVIEDTAFPSDSYAAASQIDFHSRLVGFEKRDALVRLKPREGEATLRTDDILAAIDRERGAIALVMLGGVNYLTGQLFDIATITRFAQEQGIVAGWDLAHAAGNAHVKLHDWNCDFAAWCSYKYLNSGPGAVAGAFVHERHTRDASAAAQLPRFAGWWGNDPATRFKMRPDFTPVASADAWQLSNPPVLALAPLRESLALFDRAAIGKLRSKSVALTAYLERLLAASPVAKRMHVLTPTDPAQRGAQLSLIIDGATRETSHRLLERGVYCDFREPNVIRVAPAPLYNSYHDVWRMVTVMSEVFS
ncbi:kynureninase [Phycisphaerae bacterium]|jgi:kynureninase|nr:kynureninase [Phycisphaerae bacterium]